MGLIGLLLILLLATVHSFFFSETLSLGDLTIVEGTLRLKPELSEHGGDMPTEYTWVELVGHDELYFLLGCSYEACVRGEVLDLKPGVDLKLYTKIDKLNFSKSIVYQMQTQDGRYLLNLSNYNNCKTNSWKRLVPIFLIALAMLLYNLHKIRKSPNSPLFEANGDAD